jgi:hypothetical protein
VVHFVVYINPLQKLAQCVRAAFCMQSTSSRLCLLRAIDEHPVIRNKMNELSEAMAHLITAVALDASLGGFEALESELLRTDPCFTPHTYNHALCTMLKLATTRNIEDSGCILHHHVLDVLNCGNARERCFVLMNLLFKEPRGIMFTWILKRSPLYNMRCLNAAVVAAYHARIAHSPVLCTATYRQAFLLRTIEHKRRPRNLGEFFVRRLPQHSAVPALSHRELFMHKDWFPTRQGLTAWKTGRMQWEMTELGTQLSCAARNGNDVVCGTSGHTDAMLAFCKVFTCYDLRILTLICVVWLVGSDHHSICEVLLASRAHGLAYDCQNAEEYTADMLASLA